MRAARIAWIVAGTWIAVGVVRQPVGPPLTDQRLGLHQGADALLEEQRVALRPFDEGTPERVQARVGPEHAREKIVRVLCQQRVDAELPVEQGHDPVAQDLVHCALVLVNALHHVLDHGVEEIASFLGIAVSEQFHGPLEVGKEHGDLLALAFQ
jgi:hypothetical protein